MRDGPMLTPAGWWVKQEDKTMIELSGHPMDLGWQPHRPDTWQYRFARLRYPQTMRHYQGFWIKNEPVINEIHCKAGQRVKIVMVSRLGDVGITEDLYVSTGYGARVHLEDLYDFS